MADTELIQACEDFVKAFQRLAQSKRGRGRAGYDAAWIEAERLMEAIAAHAPTTPEGIQAKARVAVILRDTSAGDFSFDDEVGALARKFRLDLATEKPDLSTMESLDTAQLIQRRKGH